LIEDVPSAVERDTYRQRLARLLKVDELLDPAQARPGRAARYRTAARPRSAPQALPSASAASARMALEGHCLGVLMRRPDIVYRLDRKLQQFGLARLSTNDFEHTEFQAIYELIQESLAQDVAEPLNFVLSGLSLELMEMADSLLKRSEKLDPNDDKVFEDVRRTLLDVRLREVRRLVEHIRYSMEESQQQGQPPDVEQMQVMQQYSRVLLQLYLALEDKNTETQNN